MPNRLNWARDRQTGLCAALLLALLATTNWLASAPAPGWGADAPEPTVQMVVDYGDSVEIRFTAIPWRSGLTALEVLEQGAAHPHGITYKLRGQGASAFITQIGDLKNEGGGAKNRNWIFKVDGKQSEVGVGACQLRAGELVLWKFEVADYNR